MTIKSPNSKKSVRSRFATHKLPTVNFRSIANLSPGLVDVYHYRTGQYVYVNNAIRHTLGIEPTDMLRGGLEFFISRIHPDDLKISRDKNIETTKAVEQLGPGVDDNKPFASFEYRVRHNDGHYVWLHTDASVYSRAPSGELEYVINTCVDITEQKAAEAGLKETAIRLRASEATLRAEHDQLIELSIAKDEFVSIVSHQLRAPATGVKQYLGLLLQGYTGTVTDAQQAVLQVAFDSNERQLAIITDMLNMARIDAGKVLPHKAEYDLGVIVEQVVEEQREKYQARRQSLKFSRPAYAVDAYIDERLIRMVVENLLDNASKYSPEGKTVTVKLSKKDGNAVLSIIDHGFGITETDQEKLFQKFSRIENDQTVHIAGTGLGLYWAKKVLDLHRGSIDIISKPRAGSTFKVTLPCN